MSRVTLTVEFADGLVRVAERGRTLTLVPVPPQDGEDVDLVIGLDDIAHWDPPHEAEDISIDDLQRLLDAIETACDRRGLAVAFD